jgi:hypothetical protein
MEIKYEIEKINFFIDTAGKLAKQAYIKLSKKRKSIRKSK